MAVPTTPVSVRLKPEVREQVAAYAAATDRSMSYVINQAIEAEMQRKAQYIKDLEAAVESSKTEWGHSAESIHVWMRSWGTENELPAPEADLPPLGK